MVKLGSLVREDASPESKPRLGTITKITDIVMSDRSTWATEVERWKSAWTHAPKGEAPDMTNCYIIRPGKVASVRWQADPTTETVHVFYDDALGRSNWSHGSNQVEVLDVST
tara:strand:+ start:16 stop:351 length:336 start_codon:yes stop_codon:yes gene_type:complete